MKIFCTSIVFCIIITFILNGCASNPSQSLSDFINSENKVESQDNALWSSNNQILKHDSFYQSSSDITISQQPPTMLVNSNGKTIWKCYYYQQYLHFSETYTGTGNFIIKILDSNQDLYSVVVNEIGSFVLDKTVEVPSTGDYYVEEIISDGTVTGQGFNPTNYYS